MRSEFRLSAATAIFLAILFAQLISVDTGLPVFNLGDSDYLHQLHCHQHAEQQADHSNCACKECSQCRTIHIGITTSAESKCQPVILQANTTNSVSYYPPEPEQQFRPPILS